MDKGSKTGSSSANDSGESGRSLCDLSSHDFATIKGTATFVDKTLFIKSFLSDNSKIVLLTAPRAFGKSTLMDMLKQFLLGKTRLFQDLKIYTEEEKFFVKHCIPHPVIHIDLGRVRGGNFAEVKNELALAVNAAFKEHKYLVKETDDGALDWASEKLRNRVWSGLGTFQKYYFRNKCTELSVPELEESLNYLSEVLHTHYGEKVFILIDEYDAVAAGMVFTTCWNKNDIALIKNLLRDLMANTLKLNNFRKRILIFARLRLAGAFSGVATRFIQHYPFLSTPRYASYLGFTEEEVKQLLQKPEVKNICRDLETIRQWYGGYIGPRDSTLKIYSSWSVLNHLKDSIEAKEPKFQSYWDLRNIKSVFTEPSIRKKIEQVTATLDSEIRITTVKPVFIQVEDIKSLNELIFLEFDELSDETVDLFLQFLADSGYFNIIKQAGYENICILKVPNFEIRSHLLEVCYSEAFNIRKEYNLRSMEIETYLNALISVLEDTTEVAFVDLAKAVVALFSGSQKMITDENEIQNVLFTLAYNSRYFVPRSEMEIKKNKKGPGIGPTLDTVITMKTNGIIFEFQVDSSKSAEEGLKQIFEKCHHTKFEEPGYEHISKKIYAGLTFNTQEKKVFITYKVGNEGESKSVST